MILAVFFYYLNSFRNEIDNYAYNYIDQWSNYLAFLLIHRNAGKGKNLKNIKKGRKMHVPSVLKQRAGIL